MENYRERHEISKASKAFQLVLADINDGDINLWAKFTFNKHTDEILEADFILKNIQSIRPRFKIHKVLFCEKHDRIEVHISHHTDFNGIEYVNLDNQKFKGLKMAEFQEVKMLIRVTPNSRISNEEWECENIATGNPDDKDGSIIIGKRP